MKKPINRQRKRRVFAVLAAVGVTVVGLIIVEATTKVISNPLRAAVASVRSRIDAISGTMSLEKVHWEQTTTSNLSHRVPLGVLESVAALQTGQHMLSIDLEALEKRLLTIPWIESVHIQKQLPSTLFIRYSLHSARALGLRKGRLWLVSASGKWIAQVSDLGRSSLLDLPVLANEDELERELAWLNALEAEALKRLASVHEVNYSQIARKMTAVMELKYVRGGHKISVIGADSPHPEALIRLKRVVQYLIKNNILVSTVDIRPGKKVVVNVGK